MSLTTWIRDRFTKRGSEPAAARRNEDVRLYLRRLEDRRVLSVTAVGDAYYMEDFSSPLVISDQLGVLANDFDSSEGTLQTVDGTFFTDLGGTVILEEGGGFTYFAPTDFGPFFVDAFTYTATNGSEFSNLGEVTLYVGEVPIPFEQPTLLPIFGVDTETPFDFVQVDLLSSVGASLTILNPEAISFDFGFNGGSEFTISGSAEAINKALDTLEYTPPLGYSGFDTLVFAAEIESELVLASEPFGSETFASETFQFVSIFVEPPGGGGIVEPMGDVIAVDDQYYVEPFQSGVFISADAGLLSNDFSTNGQFLFAVSESLTTDLGGTVEIYSDGSFFYAPPELAIPNYIDSFIYFASDEFSFSNPGFVTLFVGEVPVPEDINVPLALFTVEFAFPSENVTVQLSSEQAGALTLLNTSGVMFLSGTNGGSSFTISGLVEDVNFALDTLRYQSALHYSGPDFVTFEYELQGRQGTEVITQVVPINVLPIADAPLLSITPQPVFYQANIPVPVDIDVALVDVDGSEFLGFVILEFVPAGVVPSAGQQLAVDPRIYLLLPSELENLTFIIDAAAPENFTIVVLATSIERTTEPGVFGGPGGPLLPDHPFELRFAVTAQLLPFFRTAQAEEPPPPPSKPTDPPPLLAPTAPLLQMETLFLSGPLTLAPLLKLLAGPEAGGTPDVSNLGHSAIDSHHTNGGDHFTSTTFVSADGPNALGSDAVISEEQNDDQGRRSSENAGIYVRKLGSEGLDQTAQLPEELSEDYPRFMEFLKTLPNGDYVVYFKRGGQSHEEAAIRQVVVRVRVVNHRLNPDPGEFKPPGEVAEPPQDPNAPNIPATTEVPATEERVHLPATADDWLSQHVTTENATASRLDDWVPITAGAWMAAIASGQLQVKQKARSATVDQLMEEFPKTPNRRFRRRTGRGQAPFPKTRLRNSEFNERGNGA